MDPLMDDDEESAVIPAGNRRLDGILNLPAGAKGIVLFAHGSGSSRFSSRNRNVASLLQRAGMATLLFDLLEEEESADRANVFDIELLARRLQAATEWVARQEELTSLSIGYFGASTGAAAALVAAAALGDKVQAVVSRGGRPDLADDALPKVVASTLLIVGGDDTQVLELNRRAFAELRCRKQLTIIPGATHLFSEPGRCQWWRTWPHGGSGRICPEDRSQRLLVQRPCIQETHHEN